MYSRCCIDRIQNWSNFFHIRCSKKWLNNRISQSRVFNVVRGLTDKYNFFFHKKYFKKKFTNYSCNYMIKQLLLIKITKFFDSWYRGSLWCNNCILSCECHLMWKIIRPFWILSNVADAYIKGWESLKISLEL